VGTHNSISNFLPNSRLVIASANPEDRRAQRVERSSVAVLEFILISAPVAQLDRASGYEPEGREFESPRAHHNPNKNEVFDELSPKYALLV
jgi:hypothetical protein